VCACHVVCVCVCDGVCVCVFVYLKHPHAGHAQIYAHRHVYDAGYMHT
jgi:hypothetical protein